MKTPSNSQVTSVFTTAGNAGKASAGQAKFDQGPKLLPGTVLTAMHKVLDLPTENSLVLIRASPDGATFRAAASMSLEALCTDRQADASQVAGLCGELLGPSFGAIVVCVLSDRGPQLFETADFRSLQDALKICRPAWARVFVFRGGRGLALTIEQLVAGVDRPVNLGDLLGDNYASIAPLVCQSQAPVGLNAEQVREITQAPQSAAYDQVLADSTRLACDEIPEGSPWRHEYQRLIGGDLINGGTGGESVLLDAGAKGDSIGFRESVERVWNGWMIEFDAGNATGQSLAGSVELLNHKGARDCLLDWLASGSLDLPDGHPDRLSCATLRPGEYFVRALDDPTIRVRSCAAEWGRTYRYLRYLTLHVPSRHLASVFVMMAVLDWFRADGMKARTHAQQALDIEPTQSLGILVHRLVAAPIFPAWARA